MVTVHYNAVYEMYRDEKYTLWLSATRDRSLGKVVNADKKN
jgi:hypothetical protein